jgi:two-component system nitrate/nitrite response regulator NarL
VPTRVLICDDHRLFADAIALALCSRGVDVIAVTHSPADCLSALARSRPDVCLVDQSFPDGDGLELAGQITKQYRDVKVMMLSGWYEPNLPARARAAGAMGFATKEVGVDRLVTLIERVRAGEIVDERGPASRATDAEALMFRVTPKERLVLEKLMEGKDTAVLARELNISYATARTHIQNLRSKLGVHSKLELVALAVERRLVPVPRA